VGAAAWTFAPGSKNCHAATDYWDIV